MSLFKSAAFNPDKSTFTIEGSTESTVILLAAIAVVRATPSTRSAVKVRSVLSTGSENLSCAVAASL